MQIISLELFIIPGCSTGQKNLKFGSQVGRVGNGRKLSMGVGKREEKRCSITRPTAFTDSKASG